MDFRLTASKVDALNTNMGHGRNDRAKPKYLKRIVPATFSSPTT
jgi:hypothetical protein